MIELSHKELARFLSKFEAINDGCWLWNGCVYEKGYGYFGLRGRMCSAHRLSYQIFRGPIPEGCELEHNCHDSKVCEAKNLCKHRRCINPWHLEALTHAENIRRSKDAVGKIISLLQRSKTHCPQGHEYTPENTYFHKPKNRSIGRHCLTCMRARNLARKRA